MTPMKRPRRSLDDEDFEVVEEEGAQSDLRQDPVGFILLNCGLD